MDKLRYLLIRLWAARQGQDLVEYALLAGFVAVAAGSIFPPSVMPDVSIIFSKIEQILGQAQT